jgi:peptidoglycan glycosyltransferase
MKIFKKDRAKIQRRPTWRDYQSQLQRQPARRVFGRRAVLLLCGGATLIYCIYMGMPSTGATNTVQRPEPIQVQAPPTPQAVAPPIRKTDPPMVAPLISKADPQTIAPPTGKTDLPADAPQISKTDPQTITALPSGPDPPADAPLISKADPQSQAVVQMISKADGMISKKDAQLLLAHMDVRNLTGKSVNLPINGRRFNVETSLEPDLQARLTEAMDRKNSRFIGIVVMEADSGRILAMAGFDKTDPQSNPCLQSTFPAASLFKIVTAAAAVDHCGYTNHTPVNFNGYKHTLYKSQLKEANNHYTHTISFADSFAQSVNPVFGKLGSLRLGKDLLEEYGLGFGFNQPLDFELAVTPSHLIVTDVPYRLAEIASGFNNETTLSPLHAAVMVSAVLNKGRMVCPSLVERIVDADGRVIYRSQATWQRRAMTSKASAVVAEMMEATVQSGTARKIFRGQQRDPVLSQVRIGGKTGSISNRTNDARFDWFIGYAEAKEGAGHLAVAVMVAHEEYIGVRAGTYARMAIAHYFKNHLAHQESKSTKSNS